MASKVSQARGKPRQCTRGGRRSRRPAPARLPWATHGILVRPGRNLDPAAIRVPVEEAQGDRAGQKVEVFAQEKPQDLPPVLRRVGKDELVQDLLPIGREAESS